jgi:hypothetical protein
MGAAVRDFHRADRDRRPGLARPHRWWSVLFGIRLFAMGIFRFVAAFASDDLTRGSQVPHPAGAVIGRPQLPPRRLARLPGDTAAAGPRSAGQVFRSLLGQLAAQHSRGLADLDQVAVGIAQVAADLGTAIDRRCHELGPF